MGPPEATEEENEQQRQAANPQKRKRLPAVAGTKDGNRTKDISLLRERPSFAARRKKAKTRQGNHSIKVPLDPSSRPRGEPEVPPIGSSLLEDGG